MHQGSPRLMGLHMPTRNSATLQKLCSKLPGHLWPLRAPQSDELAASTKLRAASWLRSASPRHPLLCARHVQICCQCHNQDLINVQCLLLRPRSVTLNGLRQPFIKRKVTPACLRTTICPPLPRKKAVQKAVVSIDLHKTMSANRQCLSQE